MPEEQQEKQEDPKEKTRELQLKILGSPGLKNLFLAAKTRDKTHFGEVGKQIGEGAYLKSLQTPDEYVARVLAQPYLEQGLASRQQGRDLYESGVGMTPIKLLETAEQIYRSAIGALKVNDLLVYLDIKDTHGQISDEDKNSFLTDYHKKNAELASILIGSYENKTTMEALGNAFINEAKNSGKNLETILEAKSKESSKGEKKEE